MHDFSFHPAVQHWFSHRFQTPTQPQERGWPAIQSGANTLIAAPTGSGKTLAAFLASLDRLFRQAVAGELTDATKVVYISPLRALSNDIHKNLAEPLAGIAESMEKLGYGNPQVRTAIRTGDTTANQRQAILRRPPHILVTTPESLYLLLTSRLGRVVLSTVETVIVDEIHALADNRRGTHLALSLERLQHLTGRRLQRIGLSATQKPMSRVAGFLVGETAKNSDGTPDCRIIDESRTRDLDLALALPDSPLEAVMAAEVWSEIYRRLVSLIQGHRTTLIFVNTRRLAERVTFNLREQLGEDVVAAHHGSLSADRRVDVENRLKTGRLKAIVATASLELGIDIGHVDLVCQLGCPRTIAAVLQRIGRSGHYFGGVPKGRIFPLSRDELIEAIAMIRAIHQQRLDPLLIPENPLDILAQQIVAASANEDWTEDDLFALVRQAWSYRTLKRSDFDQVVRMLADGITTKRGRRGAHIFHDGVNGMIKGRKGARLAALTSGGAIPDLADYQVLLEPSGTFIGTLNEDFAIESMPGDVFQLGNNSWRIRKIDTGRVLVEDAQGQPPSIPFWLGEAPSRGQELSLAVSQFREESTRYLGDPKAFTQWIVAQVPMPDCTAEQLHDYLAATQKALGAMPSQNHLVLERFFDESGGMQLVIHAPFGSRLNRAWGLALRKRFCRSFNFELQAAATEDAIVLSLGPKHAFPLDEVFDYLHPKSARDVLVQALLDAPMFQTRWRWNATRSLAMLRMRGGKRIPPQIQRMEAEDLIAVVFPDQLACLENIAGDREVPDHPLVTQTIDDCLFEAMDVDGLEALLTRIVGNDVRKMAVDVPEPSPMAHEVLNAKPYAFLDDAPLEERRTQAVSLRRSVSLDQTQEPGLLDAAAIATVRDQVWPQPESLDEVHEALIHLGGMRGEELAQQTEAAFWSASLEELIDQKRAAWFRTSEAADGNVLAIAAERLPLWRTLFPEGTTDTPLAAPRHLQGVPWDTQSALVDLVRARMEVAGPQTAATLAEALGQEVADLDAALLALEAEGMVLRGAFDPTLSGLQWCNRRLLARIHHLTLQRLRAEIRPVSLQDFMRFLFHWQHVLPDQKARDQEALADVLEQLEGFESAAASWEEAILPLRCHQYMPAWLDRLCESGEISWGRMNPPDSPSGRGFTSGPLRTTPMTLFFRGNADIWQRPVEGEPELSGYANAVYEVLTARGAVFFHEIQKLCGLLATQVESGLGELAALGLVHSDSYKGLRSLLLPANRKPLPDRPRPGRRARGRGFHPQSLAYAGRWSLLNPSEGDPTEAQDDGGAEAQETFEQNAQAERWEYQARVLLLRYGIVFRKLIQRESQAPPWRELLRIYRHWEAVGEIRGGHFVAGCSGEHFALPEAIGTLRKVRRSEPDSRLVVVNACDPLNQCGWLLPGIAVERQVANRIAFRDGIPVAAWISGKLVTFAGQDCDERELLRVLAPARRPARAM
ncbi:DEAD/DEAH box helicase [Sulfidibacter corallicola]|uniref:DEAD/DEAH box helicase n=1 Tax=Sulfidibacter corallicola TaxID=2818388 RepID=A0A8A4TT62_SULCO|nr:DEAD/DEAH box helicase [Sulfidibacter corallicola]QTD52683.1 DEAD/DEAH box helicase [Sulfidibacter corallicola]